MLQLNYLRENKDEVLKRLAIKNFKNAESIISSVIEKDSERRAVQKDSDNLKSEANQIAKQIGELMKAGKKEEAEQAKGKTVEIKVREKQFDEQLKKLGDEIHTLLVQVPNAPSLKVPAV